MNPAGSLRVLQMAVQASATTWEAIEFYRQRYGIRRESRPGRAKGA